MTWDEHEELAEVIGDQGPWVRHLTTAWQTAAPGLGPIPPDPTARFVANATDSAGQHADVIAFWAPLLQLTCFGLGWTRPDFGLAAWLDNGCPTEDPVLRCVFRWWGPDRVTDLVAWATQTDAFLGIANQICTRLHVPSDNRGRLPSTTSTEARCRDPRWQRVWAGGGDPLHLAAHAVLGVGWDDARNEFLEYPSPGFQSTNKQQPPRIMLFSDHYAGWYAALARHPALGLGANGRSVRAEVVCRPVGWLGEYRRSSITGLPFRGRHRWHSLGY